MPVSVRYRFTQDLPLPPKEAYLWCTNYTEQDHALMGNANAERQITPLTDTALILKDIFHTGNGDVEKQKLVCLYPDRLCWVSTHLTGATKYSQFIYQISAKDDGKSQLEFTALHIDQEKEHLTDKEAQALAASLSASDAKIWKQLAFEMKKNA
jgi:hypothetical protein